MPKAKNKSDWRIEEELNLFLFSRKTEIQESVTSSLLWSTLMNTGASGGKFSMVSTFTALSIQGHACSYNWVTEFTHFSHIFSHSKHELEFFASMNVNFGLINPLIKCAVFCSRILFFSSSKFYASKIVFRERKV